MFIVYLMFGCCLFIVHSTYSPKIMNKMDFFVRKCIYYLFMNVFIHNYVCLMFMNYSQILKLLNESNLNIFQIFLIKTNRL